MKKEENIIDEYSRKAVNLIITEIENFETETISLSDNVTFSQYQTVQDNITHQNKGFLTKLAPGQEDDREFYDIVSPMIETAVSNIDIDTDNIEPYVDDPEHLAEEYAARVLLKNFLRQTNHGTVLNDAEYQFVDDGTIVARKVDNDGEIYRLVLPANLYVIDQSARTLEETVVIEKFVMNQTQVREMKDWDNKDKVYDMCNVGDSGLIPYYEIYYRYGEKSKKDLGYEKKEVHGIDYTYKEGDENKFVQALEIMVKAKTGAKDLDDNNIYGVIVFAEELKPEEIKITKRLKVKRYKPYEFARLGKFNGRFWGEGYREKGKPYQNRANELGNQIRAIMKLASKMVFWSNDKQIAGKNILSAIKNGQVLQATDLQLLNNVYPNLSLFAEEWNRNINECAKALKAFEVASGESLPSSTSATAIAIQNQAVGKYYNFMQERYGLFVAPVFKRWVLPELTNLQEDEVVELLGDEAMIEEIIDAYVKGWMKDNFFRSAVLAGEIPTQEEWQQVNELKKQEIMKQPKKFMTIAKGFFKGIEMYVGINTTGEAFNKQAKISNMLQLIPYITDPADVVDAINDVRQMLGLRPIKQKAQTPINQVNPAQMPMKEQSLQGQAVGETSTML